MNDNNKNSKKNISTYSMPIGLCIGIAIGTAVGAATNNFGTWIPIGLCLGFALGYRNPNGNGNGTDDKQSAIKDCRKLICNFRLCLRADRRGRGVF